MKKWRMKWNVNYKFATHYHVNEVLYKWFRKKKCPVCGSKLIYSPEEEYLGKQRLRNDPSDGFFGVIRDTYMIYHRYFCEKCQKYFSLEELAAHFDSKK